MGLPNAYLPTGNHGNCRRSRYIAPSINYCPSVVRGMLTLVSINHVKTTKKAVEELETIENGGTVPTV